MFGPDPVAPVPFGEVTLTEAGGVDGRRNVLVLRPDGVALAVTREPAAGRLAPATMARVEELFASEQFRVEAARRVEQSNRCADEIYRRVALGSISVTRGTSCDRPLGEDLPAYRELVQLLGPALRGEFDGPVDDPNPALPAVTLIRQGAVDDPYEITVDPDGSARLTGSDQPDAEAELTEPGRDALRMLLVRIRAAPRRTSAWEDPYRLTFAGTAVTPGEIPEASPEVRAVIALLEDTFSL